MILRRHALKLRYWPGRNPKDERGVLLDVDWSWIQALKGLDVGELRIGDKIGGHDNVRVIFFAPDTKPSGSALPVLWILAAFPKKGDEFSAAQIKIFRFRRQLIIKRAGGW
jgi:hypothetical protein